MGFFCALQFLTFSYQTLPMHLVRAISFLSLLLYFTSSCQSNTPSQKEPKTDTLPPNTADEETVKGNFSSQQEIKFSKDSLTAFFQRYPKFKEFETDFKTFYEPRGYAFAWYDQKGLIEQASNLMNYVVNVKEQGIPTQAPYETEYSLLIDSANTMSGSQPNIEVELMSTAEYMWFAKTTYMGLSEKQSLDVDWLVPRKKISSTALLDSILKSKPHSVTEPVNRQYGLLRTWLKKYRDIESGGGWVDLKPDKKKIQLGDSSSFIIEVRKRLWKVEDLSKPDTLNPVFDSELQSAVKSFQYRYGFSETGVIDAKLVKEMNYPVSKRIEQIIVNMERARWVPERLEGDFIVVNIPEYRFHANRSDSLVWSMKVVVGRQADKTVIFSGDLKYVVFSPYWVVPPGILKKEILPGMQRDKNYLAKHNMEIFGYSGSTPQIRERPGKNNSLGLVKFLFPNSHNIYLHDTPAKSLFGEDKRAFSHGCIRVSEPKRLAAYLLRKDPGWTDAKITAAMNAGKETWVTLKDPVPVFIVYFTSFVDRQGKLNFREDIYNRDSRLARMIMEKPKI